MSDSDRKVFPVESVLALVVGKPGCWPRVCVALSILSTMCFVLFHEEASVCPGNAV